MKRIRDYFFAEPKSLSDVLLKSTIAILIGLVLMVGLRVVDGDSHRLGTITFSQLK